MDELSVEAWVHERLDNCQRLAAQKTGRDRDGWLEDARYFSRILERMSAHGALAALLDRDITYVGPVAHLPFMTHAQAVTHITEARRFANAKLGE